MAIKSPEAKERARLAQKAARSTPEYRARANERMKQYRAANSEKLREQARARYAADPDKVIAAVRQWQAENRDKYLAMNRAYKRDPQKVREHGRRYYEDNKDALREARKAWRLANPERCADYAHRHRAGEMSGSVSVRDWRRLVGRFGGCCAYCGGGGPLERDHVVPICRGGKNTIGNLLPACRSCNAKKHMKLLVEWGVRVA